MKISAFVLTGLIACLGCLLVVPLGVVGAVLATRFSGLSNDVYFQVGLLTTVGLAAKNAILIVEFAKHLQEQGNSLIDATLEVAEQTMHGWQEQWVSFNLRSASPSSASSSCEGSNMAPVCTSPSGGKDSAKSGSFRG